jgi:hypothetical protein
VDPLLETFAFIGQFVLDLYYQYGEDRIKYHVLDKAGNLIQREIKRGKLFNPNVSFQVNGTSVFSSPEVEFSRMTEIYNFIAQDPTTAQDPKIRVEMLKRVLDAGRVSNLNALLPELSEQPEKIPTEQEVEAETDQQSQERKIQARQKEQEAMRRQEAALALLEQSGQNNEVPAAA